MKKISFLLLFIVITSYATEKKLDGNIEASAEYSDIRLKKNIFKIDSSTAKVMKIKGVYYSWKNPKLAPKGSGNREIGVIAQDVEKVLPEIVYKDSKGYKKVNYERLSALLIEAVKDQQRQLDSQTEKLKEVYNTVEMVKNLLNENALLRKQIASLKDKVDPKPNVNLHYDLEEKKKK